MTGDTGNMVARWAEAKPQHDRPQPEGRSQPREPVVEVRELTFAYAEQPPVFERFSWTVRAGEAWCIIGPSGCGKSTLLYLVAGLRQPRGTILVDGQPVPRPLPPASS